MRFTPKTEAEVNQEIEERKAKFKPWARGKYDCEIRTAVEGVSKSSGKEMITLNVEVFDAEGNNKFLDFYVTESSLFATAKAFGLMDKYNIGELSDTDFERKTGQAQLTIKKGDRAPDGGFYPDKNQIQHFVEPEVTSSKGVVQHRDDLADEIPFAWIIGFGLSALLFIQSGGIA